MARCAIPERSASLAVALAILVACCAYPARAEPPGRLAFRSYGTHEGLGNLVVVRLAQDRDGFLWVATEDGLFRHDGSRFERFGNDEGLPSSVTSALAIEDGAGVWVGTLRGLARWQGTRFRAVGLGNGLPEERVNGIAISQGRLWVAMQSGLYGRRTDSDRFQPVAGWTAGEPTAVWADEDGGLVVASAGGLQLLTAAGKWSTLATDLELRRETVDALVRDRRGVLWARSPNRLWSRRPGTPGLTDETAHVPRADQKGTLSLDRQGRVLVPNTEGLARDEDGRWTLLGAADGLPVRSLLCALEDDEGSLWVGAIGLHQVLGRGLWRVFGRKEGLEGEISWTQIRDAHGRLWVGTDHGLARDLGSRWEMVPAFRGRSVRAIAVASDGALWLGGAPAKVFRLAPGGAIETFDARAGILGKRILRILIDRSGTVWVATDGAGLLRKMSGSRTFSRVALPGGTDDERIGHLSEDREGRIWAAGELGLAMLESSGWRRFTLADGLRVTRTAYVLERRNGEICVAYLESLGLTCFRARSPGLADLRHLDASNGLPGARVYLLGEDRDARLWVGTGRGVAVFGPGGIEQFTEAQGLPSDDTAAMSFLAEANGDVWVGTSGGLSRFSGARYAHVAPPPRARIVSARLGQRDLDPASPVLAEAPHADDTLLVQFAGLSFLDPFRVEHEVRLRPLEREWHGTKVREARYAALGTGSYTFEVRARMPSGRWSEIAQIRFAILPAWWQHAWFLALLSVLGTLGIAGLVTASVRRHEARRDRDVQARHEASFRALIKGLPDVVIVHREGRVVYANTAAARLLGWNDPAAMVGLVVLDLVEPSERPAILERIRRLAETGEPAPPKEERLLRRDGSIVTLEISGISLDFAGQRAAVAVARDVTERKQLQERLLLSDRMASVGTLAAGVAHEINNPLSYTIANLGLLASEVPRLTSGHPEWAQTVNELIDDARDGAERVRKIVRGLKAFSRAADEDCRLLDPARVVDQAIVLASNEIRHRARLVKAYVAVPPLWADESRLVQVFINLLVNAAHSIPEGHAEENEILLSIRPRGPAQVQIEVRDTGSGIRPEIIGHIFDPFFTTKPVGEGTGLGLSICHGIVNRMGGEIRVESQVGKGSVFTVVLPVSPAQAVRPPAQQTSSPGGGRRGRVLVVDDDLLVAESIRRVLVGEHDVTLLADGATALSHLSSVARYDVILCDLMMPRMTGMELHERLAAVGSPQVENFVFMTGGAFTTAARRFLEQIPNERLEKPFDNAALKALVRRFVSSTAAVPAATA
ncbi:MAG: hypothetical protein NVSMB23_24500 [Myxococcales bacterium]